MPGSDGSCCFLFLVRPPQWIFSPFDGETAGVCDIIRQIQPHSQLDTTTDSIGLSEWIVAFHLLHPHQSSQAKNISDRRGSKRHDDLDTIVKAYQSDVNRIQACPNFVLSFPNSKLTRILVERKSLPGLVVIHHLILYRHMPSSSFASASSLEKSIHTNPSS